MAIVVVFSSNLTIITIIIMILWLRAIPITR